MRGKRRTMLFVPGDKERMISKIPGFESDGIFLDLEDAVSMDNKELARDITGKMLPALLSNCGKKEIVVRINPLTCELGYKDVLSIAPLCPDAILLPKASKETVKTLGMMLDAVERDRGLGLNGTEIITLIETADGLLNIREVLSASDRVTGALFGAEDLTYDLGISRTKEGAEIETYRRLFVMACKARGIDALDTPFTAISDLEGLIRDAFSAKTLGMTGKALIHPSHISSVNAVFTPNKEEAERAKRIVDAFEEGLKEHKGAIQFEGAMLDAPIVNRARRTVMQYYGEEHKE